MSIDDENARRPGQYDARIANAIEEKWQRYWRDHRTFAAPNPGEPGFDPSKPKRYVLDMFPFPSGAGLHVGHPRGYIATDVYARYLRMNGYNVLHGMGFDAFGLPAEQFAIETGTHPRITTEQNIAAIRKQLDRLGLAHDKRRSVATSDVSFYKWTQWIFLQIFNSWYDATRNKARPIAELVREFESGASVIDRPSALAGRTWSGLTDLERQSVINSYRLVYLDEVDVNWSPALGTVLANEEVTAEGRSERGDHPVYRRPLKQWMMRITAYADRLADELDAVEWSDSIKAMQRNWIGRSEGVVIEFRVAGNDDAIEVFTTRPDTLFGASYLLLAPESSMVDRITGESHRAELARYRERARRLNNEDRASDARQKTGVFTGAYAINPASGARIPIWIADYVITGYGTGAIMGVPAHDERDFEFARTFELPIRAVVMPPDEWLSKNRPEAAALRPLDAVREYFRNDPGSFTSAFVDDGIAIQSSSAAVSLDGLPSADAKKRMLEWLERSGRGEQRVQYKLRDWLFSRQRYWGEPIPILHGPNGELRAVAESKLPVELPELDDFRPETSDDPDRPPTPPLSRAPASWRLVELDGTTYTRELNTMPQWAGSCWYYLRYLDPSNERALCDAAIERYWMAGDAQGGSARGTGGVDLYVGGIEHAVLHLLYARFWHKVLYDLGHVSTSEPFARLYNQGYVLAVAFRDQRGVYVPAADVVDQHGEPIVGAPVLENRRFFYHGKEVAAEFGKMGKSLKNGVSPDNICQMYGADTLRLYEMSMGPLNASQPWDPRDIVGLYRFLARVWRNLIDERTDRLRVVAERADEPTARLLAKTTAKVRSDVERLAFHTAIAKLIEFNNHLTKLDHVPLGVARALVLLLAPFAPHVAEELWQRLGGETSLAYAPYPQPDEELLLDAAVEVAVAVSGKTRSKIVLHPRATKIEAEEIARHDSKVARFLEGKIVTNVVYVPGRMLNFVVR
jgi:leucyl-tRNA synthetase